MEAVVLRHVDITMMPRPADGRKRMPGTHLTESPRVQDNNPAARLPHRSLSAAGSVGIRGLLSRDVKESPSICIVMPCLPTSPGLR